MYLDIKKKTKTKPRRGNLMRGVVVNVELDLAIYREILKYKCV